MMSYVRYGMGYAVFIDMVDFGHGHGPDAARIGTGMGTGMDSIGVLRAGLEDRSRHGRRYPGGCFL